jgi:uncharacterized protein
VSDSQFTPLEFLPRGTFEKITDIRVKDPGAIARVAKGRRRRRTLAPDGRLCLLAADHPARMVTGIRNDPLRMGRRQELLARVLRVMACSPFDGLLGTADIIDDLFAVESLGRTATRFLDGKVLIGSVNRGGVAGATFELDDRVTGYDVDGVIMSRLDGAKFLLRFDPEDANSLRTLKYCVQVVRECGRRGVPLFLEPLPVIRKDGRVRMDNDREKLVRVVGMATGLGSSTANIWMKLPYCEGFEDVAGATTLPILLLGGEASDDVHGLLSEISRAMKAGPNVRGVLMGRNLLYPPSEDPLPLAMAVHSIVHDGTSADQAAGEMGKWAGKKLHLFRSNH